MALHTTGTTHVPRMYTSTAGVRQSTYAVHDTCSLFLAALTFIVCFAPITVDDANGISRLRPTSQQKASWDRRLFMLRPRSRPLSLSKPAWRPDKLHQPNPPRSPNSPSARCPWLGSLAVASAIHRRRHCSSTSAKPTSRIPFATSQDTPLNPFGQTEMQSA